MKATGLRNILFGAVCTLFTITAWAGTDDPADVQKKLNSMRSMSADFSQTVRVKSREVSRSSGTMALLRPGRFRWQTQDPMEQIVVADGQKLWIYDVDLEQVTVKRQDKSIGGTPALFLSGANDTVARDFEVSRCTASRGECFDLRARSKDANFQRLQLVFSGDTLTRLDLYDQLGQHTEVHLTKIRNNPPLKASLFQFKPPRGVDVIRQ